MATAKDDKNRGTINNDLSRSVVENNLEDRKVQNPGEMAASPSYKHGEYACNNTVSMKVINYLFSISPRDALANWDVGPGNSDAIPVCLVTVSLSKKVSTTRKDYFQ